MARVINVQDLTMRIGARQLVGGASFRVDKGMRIGLVGRNGAGKTTMTKLLAASAVAQGSGQPVADADERHGLEAVEHEGTISCHGTVGYLPQDTKVGDLEEAARDRILSARGIDQLLARIRKAEARIAGPYRRGPGPARPGPGPAHRHPLGRSAAPRRAGPCPVPAARDPAAR